MALDNCSLPFECPSPSATGPRPRWTGRGFTVDGRLEPVLAYDVGKSGWDEGLTDSLEKMHAGNHFIDIASRAHALDEMRKQASNPRAAVLEVGCSSGFFLRDLVAEYPSGLIVGADYVLSLLRRLAERFPGVPLMRFDLARCPLPDGIFDAIVALNVLEHIEDDQAAIMNISRLLRPGGIAVIEVPAGAALFDFYDAQWMHHRRYDMTGLVKLVEGAGMSVIARSHLGFFMWPAFVAAKFYNRFAAPADLATKAQHTRAGNVRSGRLGGAMKAVMRMEAFLRRHVYLPVGVRCLITARKPPE